MCPGVPRKVYHGNPCTANHSVSWAPNEWMVQSAVAARPVVARKLLEELCEGLTMHVVDPTWEPVLRSRRTYAKLFDIVNGTRSETAKQLCVSTLQSFQPRVCSLEKVFVTSSAKRMFNASSYFVPRRSANDLARSRDCYALRRVAGCGGHVALARSPLGVAFYHTMYDTFGGVAYLLEHIKAHRGTIKILENMCNIDHEYSIKAKYSRKTLSDCPRGILPFFIEMASFLGLNASADVQHYPYGRQVHGGSFYVERATFDCSDHSSFRDFWHAVKLRNLFHARFESPPPPQRAIVVIDRNKCSGTRAKQAGCSWSGRGVAQQTQINRQLRAAFQGSELEVVEFQGGSLPFASQAAIFRRAASVVGPHGAALANLIFCQPGARVVEYVHLPHFPLYAGYANVFELQYWPVVDATRKLNYGGIEASDVERVVECALAAAPSLLGSRASKCTHVSKRVVLNSEHLLTQSASAEGWTSFNRKIDGYGSPQPW